MCCDLLYQLDCKTVLPPKTVDIQYHVNLLTQLWWEPTTSHCLLQSVTTAPINICSTYPLYIHCKYGGYQLPSSASPNGPYFSFVLRTCSDVTQAYRSFKCPYNFLGTKHQDLFFNGDQNLKKHGILTKSSLIFLPIFCLIQNCFKHPTFSNYCIFSIKFCQYNQKFLL